MVQVVLHNQSLLADPFLLVILVGLVNQGFLMVQWVLCFLAVQQLQ
jgi:hypothetical protein